MVDNNQTASLSRGFHKKEASGRAVKAFSPFANQKTNAYNRA
jgi:hypothetical protein